MSDATVILQMICPDRPGLVSELAGWVAANGGSIRHADHHTDAGAGLFLSRIEWQLQGFGIPRDVLPEAAQALGQRLGGEAQLHFSDDHPRVAIFASKQSHCLQDLALAGSKRGAADAGSPGHRQPSGSGTPVCIL